MGRGMSKAAGGSARARENAAPARKVSDLEAFRENARQLNVALDEARRNRSAILEYEDMTGKTYRFYWNGATFVDRSRALYTRDRNGTLKKKFKRPKSWD